MSFDCPEVLLPEHFGFCEGVVAADDLLRNVTTAAAEAGIPRTYGYHDIVHNASVRAEHEANGTIFVEDPSEAPDNSIVVTSAHGSSPEIMHAFNKKGCLVFDAACPLVIHTHRMVQVARRDGDHVLYVVGTAPGRDSKIHDEVLGTMGHLNSRLENGQLIDDSVGRHYVKLTDNPGDIAEQLRDCGERFRIITQTTLDADACFEFRASLEEAILNKIPSAVVSMSSRGDVCRAVRDRQEGVRVLLGRLRAVPEPTAIVVVTDPKSKNGMGYYKEAEEIIDSNGMNTTALHVQTADEMDGFGPVLDGRIVAVTASASTPDRDVAAVLTRLSVDAATTIPERPRFNLRHGDGTNLSDKREISRLIGEWQLAA